MTSDILVLISALVKFGLQREVFSCESYTAIVIVIVAMDTLSPPRETSWSMDCRAASTTLTQWLCSLISAKKKKKKKTERGVVSPSPTNGFLPAREAPLDAALATFLLLPLRILIQ